jgi:hypothetical protein
MLTPQWRKDETLGMEVVAYGAMRRLNLETDTSELDEGDIPAHHAAVEAGSVYGFEMAESVWFGSWREFEDWRGRLAQLVAGSGRKKPFRPLIGFDRDQGDGMIRSRAAAKLTQDFMVPLGRSAMTASTRHGRRSGVVSRSPGIGVLPRFADRRRFKSLTATSGSGTFPLSSALAR